MKELEISGKNIEEAISLGLAQLNCTKDDVDIKILDEGTKGLFGLMGSKPAKVLLTLKKTVPVPESADSSSDTDSAPASEKKDERNRSLENVNFAIACKNAQEYVTKIVSLMNIKVEKVRVSCDDVSVNVEVESDSGSLLIGKGGQCLSSLEYIVQLMLNNNPETRVKVNVDTGGYRQKQYARLTALAERAMYIVRKTGRPYRFEAMPAKERRFIHTFFEKFGEFETFSEGEGSLRKVGVKLLGQND